MISNENDIVLKYRLFEDIMDLLKHTADSEYNILNRMDQLDRSKNWAEFKFRVLKKEFIKESEKYNKEVNELQQRGKRETGIDIFFTIHQDALMAKLKFNLMDIKSDAYPECKRIYKKIQNMEVCTIFTLFKDDNSYNAIYFNDYNTLANTFNRLRDAFLDRVGKGILRKIYLNP